MSAPGVAVTSRDGAAAVHPVAALRITDRFRKVFPLVALAVVIAVPLSGSRLWLYNMLIVAILATATIGLNILTGRAGQVSFAQTSFMAIGGYGLALFTTRLHWNPWLSMALAALIAAVVAFLIGFPLLRLRGHYLAMGTFALALGTTSFADAATFLTGGAVGISGVPPFTLGAFNSLDQVHAYILCWACCRLALAVFAAAQTCYVGRAWRALALREDVAAGLGIHLHGYKTLAFVIAAVLAALAGALYVGVTSFVGPELYDAGIAINMFVILFIGGRGALFGPVLGSMLVVLGPQVFSFIADWQNAIFLLILLLVIMFMPRGLLGRT
jgi:branched-chain amino acid transport system permease protein